jgi:restriction system protein
LLRSALDVLFAPPQVDELMAVLARRPGNRRRVLAARPAHRRFSNPIRRRILLVRQITVYSEYLKWGESWTTDDEVPYEKTPYRRLYASNGRLLSERAGIPATCSPSVKDCPYCSTRLESPGFSPAAKEWDSCGGRQPKRYRRSASGTGLLCPGCGWWYVDMHSVDHTDSFGPSFHETATFEAIQKSFDLESRAIPIDVLRDYLMKNTDAARYTDPVRFEQLVGAVYRDLYQCEVRHVGGPGDAGIDLYAVSCDTPHLIQVKRRSARDAVESVRIVRELIGTLIVKGAKVGEIVTTAVRFSRAAEKLATDDALTRRGIQIKLHGLARLHDMLQIVGRDINEIWERL